MKGLSEVTAAGRLHVKRFDRGPFGEALFRAECEAYKALDPLGLVPDAYITRSPDGKGTIVTATCEPFAEYARGLTREVAVDFITFGVRRLHEAGWAHRDLRIENIVNDEGSLRFIDLEFACRVDPAGKPYDLYGPEASGVPAPEMHRFLGISVWWDTKNDASLALARHFGALGEAK